MWIQHAARTFGHSHEFSDTGGHQRFSGFRSVGSAGDDTCFEQTRTKHIDLRHEFQEIGPGPTVKVGDIQRSQGTESTRLPHHFL